MRKYLYLITMLIIGCSATAQTDLEKEFRDFEERAGKDFSSFEHNQQQQFDEFRRKVNAEFAEQMGRKWETEQSKEAVPAPKLPEPPKPVYKEKGDKKPLKQELDASPVNREPMEEYVAPKPAVPIVKNETDPQPTISFNYYGKDCNIVWRDDMAFRLSAAGEHEVSKAWKQLSTEKYDNLIADCLQLKEAMNLCDWAYLELLDKFSERVFGSSENERVVLKMYLLTQSGYKMRIAKNGSTLALLMPAREEVYDYSYLEFDQEKFYVLNKNLKGSFEVFKLSYPQEQTPSLRMTALPKLPESKASQRTFTSKNYPDIKVSIEPNTNLMNFYTAYPHSNWSCYPQASLSYEVKNALYPSLKAAMAGKSQIEAANVLINFVQTAFEYKTDEEQFGCERTFFGDELFFYPYSDCEDRSVLFSILVRELLGLDVVFLHYPGHLATAVRFTEKADGFYITLDNKEYTVCDPTYIGANIGEAMPQFEKVPAEIIRITPNK